MESCCPNLGEIARHHATSNLYISVEGWEEASNGLEQRRFTSAIGTNDTDTFTTTEGKAARAGDLNLRRLSIADGCLAESQRFSWAAPSPFRCNRERDRLPLTYHGFDRRQTALMLMHLCVLAMASIRLNELALTFDLFLTAICVALITLIRGAALFRIGAVVATEARYVVSANLPNSIDDGI